MENENNENQDSLILDETQLDETTEEVDVEKLKETNKKLFERAKKAEADKKALAEQLKKNPSHINNKEESAPVPNVEDKVWQIAEMIREGYDRNDVDFIMKNGGRDALKDPNSYVSVALKGKMEQKRAENEASKLSTSGGSGDIERKYTPEELRNMPLKDLEKILPRA